MDFTVDQRLSEENLLRLLMHNYKYAGYYGKDPVSKASYDKSWDFLGPNKEVEVYDEFESVVEGLCQKQIICLTQEELKTLDNYATLFTQNLKDAGRQ